MNIRSSFGIFIILFAASILLVFSQGCIKEEDAITGNKIDASEMNKSGEDFELVNNVSEPIYDSFNNTDDASEVLNDSLLNESAESVEELENRASCVTSYPMLYLDENGVYRSTEIKFKDENYSISLFAIESEIDISFNPRIDTINPDEERYSHATGYYRRLPNDESSCINPELIFDKYSVAVCNITSFKQEYKNSLSYQGEVIVYNHSVQGCIANHSTERRVWLSGCKEGSTVSTCNLQGFSEETIGITANQKYADEIKSITIRVNNGDVLPSWDMFQTDYFTALSFKIATDSLSERLYKLDVEITLKNGRKEEYERQIRVVSPPPLSDYEFDPDCFSFVTLRKDSSKNIDRLGEVTLKNIFRMPQMVYLEVGRINTPWVLSYGTERSARFDYKVTGVDFDKEEITLRTYDPFCKGIPG